MTDYASKTWLHKSIRSLWIQRSCYRVKVELWGLVEKKSSAINVSEFVNVFFWEKYRWGKKCEHNSRVKDCVIRLIYDFLCQFNNRLCLLNVFNSQKYNMMIIKLYEIQINFIGIKRLYYWIIHNPIVVLLNCSAFVSPLYVQFILHKSRFFWTLCAAMIQVIDEIYTEWIYLKLFHRNER